MQRLLVGSLAGALVWTGLALAPAQAQEWQSQWEAHHTRYNNWRPQSHNKDYGWYGHHWMMGPDGYYYGNPNTPLYMPPPFWTYTYPNYMSYGPGYGGYYYWR
jgi:hypothetical protein